MLDGSSVAKSHQAIGAKSKFIDSFLFGRMTSPAFQPKQSSMRSFFDIAELATTRLLAGGVAVSMTKTTKTA
jgi:hypothetical protein